MSTDSLDVSIGARLWFQGSAWTVVEHDGATVLLRSGDNLRKVHAPSLVGLAQPLDDQIDEGQSQTELDAVVLSALSATQRRAVEAEAQVFDDLVLGMIEVPLEERYQRAGEQLRISARTARRRAARYADRGLVGLVDARLLQTSRRSVAQEWDQACLQVLDSFKDLSNPTMKSVLSKTNALYLQDHPGAAVPSQAVAYRRLRELDKGHYTFGAAKQRRSVAERPQGVLARRCDGGWRTTCSRTGRLAPWACVLSPYGAATSSATRSRRRGARHALTSATDALGAYRRHDDAPDPVT